MFDSMASRDQEMSMRGHSGRKILRWGEAPAEPLPKSRRDDGPSRRSFGTLIRAQRELRPTGGLGVWLSVILCHFLLNGAFASPVILSVDRHYRGEESKLVEAGEILLTELNCVNCHRATGSLASRFPTAPVPNLQNLAGRIRYDYAEQWISDPHRTKSGARMPDLLVTLDNSKRKSHAAELTAFLWSLGKAEDLTYEKLAWNPDKGKALYHSIGCVACHAPAAEFTTTANGAEVNAAAVATVSVPLGKIGDKYTRSGLIEFLLAPEEARPASRMPRMNLEPREAADVAAYLTQGMSLSSTKLRAGGKSLQIAGRKSFTSLGCALCHDVNIGGKKLSSDLKPFSLSAIAGKSGGCLDEKPNAGIPWYGLDEFQRKALRAALANVSKATPLTASEQIHRKMVALNCYACHQRDGIGGPDAERLKYFESSGSDLGDEGRVPPLLTGVGRKITQTAIARTIQGQMPVRPYMNTMMPGFHKTDADALAILFATADADPDEIPTPRDGEEFQVGRNMWGRALLGTKGLSCIACHQLNGRKSLGIQSMDLAHATKRLRPEWFRDYVIDPAKYRPGTRMPSFWPEGKPMLKGNGSSTKRQIDSVWVYLNELDQSRLPEGLETKANFLLQPKDRPIVFRTFMEQAGLHAIAVGYPQGVHAAFDSQNPRWAMAWTGKFLDAESTWDDRFTPLAKPEGEKIVAIQPNPPQHEDGKANVSFKGYRLRKGYPPEFDYRVNDANITDQFSPSRYPENGKMTRAIGKVGTSQPLWFEVANGKLIKKMSAGTWKVDGKLTIKFQSATDAADNPDRVEARITDSPTGQHLQFLLKNTGNRSMTYLLSVLYDW